MDRIWITKGVRRLSSEHLKVVANFMQFVRTSFATDVAILCPCCQCLNRKELPQGRVEDHLLLNGMASTYDRWIHHGEPLHDWDTQIFVYLLEMQKCWLLFYTKVATAQKLLDRNKAKAWPKHCKNWNHEINK